MGDYTDMAKERRAKQRAKKRAIKKVIDLRYGVPLKKKNSKVKRKKCKK
jgi:hypothetical protein